MQKHLLPRRCSRRLAPQQSVQNGEFLCALEWLSFPIVPEFEAAASAFIGSHGCTSSGKSSMGTVDRRTVGFQRLIFLEMRNDAAPAFKRTYIGQCAETLRPSDQSHVLSAAWT